MVENLGPGRSYLAGTTSLPAHLLVTARSDPGASGREVGAAGVGNRYSGEQDHTGGCADRRRGVGGPHSGAKGRAKGRTTYEWLELEMTFASITLEFRHGKKGFDDSWQSTG
jgi:hypothetical protein